MTPLSVHVIPKGNAWAVVNSGSDRVLRIFDQQLDAIEFALEHAKKHDRNVFVHRLDGKITTSFDLDRIDLAIDMMKCIRILTLDGENTKKAAREILQKRLGIE